MNLESVLEMWKKDSEIPQYNLDETSRQTPTLHAKYMEFMSIARLQLKKAEMEQKTLLKKKWLYYNGKMTQEQIEKEGWEFDPFEGLKVLKGEMDYYYDADSDIQKSEEKITYYKTYIETLTEIINVLKWRHSTIKNIIDWRRFEAGG
jgi:c-di-GMP-related signal transduction protein|tara:strand:+ start:655 stop:1098 length:444 start_codon:yes stop_codon:yes gene_type:complete